MCSASKRRFFDICSKVLEQTQIRGKITAEKEKCKMNTKTTKFLAVLAVLAFAFAAFAAVTTSVSDSDATTSTYDKCSDIDDGLIRH